MRLLNVETRKLQEFVVNIPKYAILSHTWGDDEVTFQDLGRPDHTKKRGYTKIDGLCCLAAKNGFEWVWVDTCCIDKRSSAELSEAINSMYRWYEDASICYAYLEDIQPEKCPAYIEDGKPHKDLDRDDDKWSSDEFDEPDECEYPEAFVSHFGSSRWFTRGWTLQELLTPRNLRFFNAAWREIGTRSSLAHRIESITSIPAQFLRKRSSRSLSWLGGLYYYPAFRSAKVAVRMSWAARRQTTRVEDAAYSLLGIFDVNMPLLYGEGEKAFERLQLEILKESPDESILAWRLPCELGSLISLDSLDDRDLEPLGRKLLFFPDQIWTLPDPRNLLASSPVDFAGWFGTQSKEIFETRNSIMEMTNRGLRITLPLVKGQKYSYGVFNCMLDNTFEKVLAIRLLHTNVADEYQNSGLVTLSWRIVKRCQKKTFHCVKPERFPSGIGMAWDHHREQQWIHLPPPHGIPERLVDVIPKDSYDEAWRCVLPWWKDSKMGRILLHYKQDLMDAKQGNDNNGDGFVVILSPRSALAAFFSLEMTPPPFVCHTLSMPKGEKLEHLLSREEYCHIYETPLDDDYHELSKLGSRFVPKFGVPQARIERDNKLSCDHWDVNIYKTQSLAEYAGSIVRPIKNLRSFSEPGRFRSYRRNPSLYGNDLLLSLVPVVAWWMNSKRHHVARSWKEATTCGGLALLLYLLRYKAYLALLSQERPRSISDVAGFYHRVVYMPFALWFPFAMYTLFPHSRKEVKVHPLLSVLTSMAIVILVRRGQKFL